MNFWNLDSLKEALENAKFYNFPENWSANGMVIWHDNFEDGNMVLIRTEGQTKGMLVANHEDIIERASALMAHKPFELFKYNKPIIELVGSNGDALIKMSRYIRRHFQGKVIGVTGSSGKSTTTQMITDVLSSKCPVDSNCTNRFNTTWGIAWNMTRFGIDSKYWVIETSLGGGMSKNSAITKPNCAVVLNVAPVHITGTMTLQSIAEEKSKIFHAMEPGGTAVIYREMQFFDVVKSAADFKNLKVITFGESEDADIRIVTDGDNKFIINGNMYILNSEPTGKHLLLDMAAALAVAGAENYEIEDALNVLRKFKSLEGRGEVSDINLADGRHITLVDESYNANPLSMAAAITAFGEKYKDNNKILVLGDMAECGEEAERYHKELSISVDKISPQKIYLCGKDIKVLYEEIKDKYNTEYFTSLNELKSGFCENLQDGDCVLVKASHSGNLHTLVSDLKKLL